MAKIDLKALEHLFFDEWNKGKAALLAVIDKTCANNIVFHSALGKEIRGINELKQFMSALCDAIPDTHVTTEDMVVEGNKVAYRYTKNGKLVKIGDDRIYDRYNYPRATRWKKNIPR